MSVVYETAVKEDLNLGYGTVSRTMPAGGSDTGNKIGIHTFLQKVFNVMDQGATGDGVTNDAAACQAAFDLATAAGGIVYFPPGTYYCASALSITSPGITKRIIIMGGGRDVTVIKGAGGSAKVLDFTDVNMLGLRDITVNGNGTTTAAIYFHSVSPGTTTCSGNVLEKLNINTIGAAGAGIWFNDVDTSTLHNCKLIGSSAATSVGWRVDNTQSVLNVARDCVFGFFARGVSNAETSSPGAFKLVNCDFEINTVVDIALKSVTGVEIYSCFTEGSLRFIDTLSPISEKATLLIVGGEISSVTDPSDYAIHFTSTASVHINGLQMPNGHLLNFDAGGSTQLTIIEGLDTPAAAPFVMGSANKLIEIGNSANGSSQAIRVRNGEIFLDTGFAIRWLLGGASQVYDDGTCIVVSTLAGSGNSMMSVNAAGRLVRDGSLTPSNVPKITSGAGAPGTTPGKIGDIYCDTSGAKAYIATGASGSGDWKILN